MAFARSDALTEIRRKKDREEKPYGVGMRTYAGILLAVLLCLYVWRTYRWYETGVDPARKVWVFLLGEHTEITVPLFLALLAAGLFLATRRYIRKEEFGIKPFWIIAGILALGLLAWKTMGGQFP